MTDSTSPATDTPAKAKPNFFSLILLLSLATVPVLVRLLTLETLSIVDPTEARYATIAQHMVSSGDWTTPNIPVVGGFETYLGKPPLHFWLTGLSFAMFGQDEWVARFPSFICGFLAVAIVGFFAWRLKGAQAAALSITFLSSAAVFFFFSGASVVDVTLTAFTTAAVGAYMLRIFSLNTKRQALYEFLLFAAMAGGFMTKGPIAIVLSGLPAFLFCVIERKLEYLKPFFSLRPIIFFALLVIPWFVLSEIRNPGFLKYFIVNENFGRYFLKDYGDKYGVGHRHMLGSVWWMFAVGTLPWGLLLIPLFQQRRAWLSGVLRQKEFRFLICWTIATPLFFTFVKQLHMGYIVPALPPFAILLSYLCVDHEQDLTRWLRHILIGFLAVVPVISIVGLIWGATLTELGITFSLLAAAFIFFKVFSKPSYASLVQAGACLSLGFAALIFAIKPFIDARNSSREILQAVNDGTQDGEFKVGIIRARNYSPWYYASASKQEFGREMNLVTMKPEELDATVPNIIMKLGDERLLDDNFTKQYELKAKKGAWEWYVRLPITIPPVPVIPEVDSLGLIPTVTPTPDTTVDPLAVVAPMLEATPAPTVTPDSSTEEDDSSEL